MASKNLQKEEGPP
jgi:hypothetical protein